MLPGITSTLFSIARVTNSLPVPRGAWTVNGNLTQTSGLFLVSALSSYVVTVLGNATFQGGSLGVASFVIYRGFVSDQFKAWHDLNPALQLLAIAALALLLASPAVAQWRSSGAEIPLEGDGRVTGVRLADDEVETREIDTVVVAGKTEPIAIYELMGPKGCLDERLCAFGQLPGALGRHQHQFEAVIHHFQTIFDSNTRHELYKPLQIKSLGSVSVAGRGAVRKRSAPACRRKLLKRLGFRAATRHVRSASMSWSSSALRTA